MLLLFIELFIGLFVHDGFIRPHVGDYLVVMLLYCFFRSFIRQPPMGTALAVLLLAYGVELAQYFSLAKRVGVQSGGVAAMVLGSSFDWGDMLAYTAGIMTILFFERKRITV